MSEKARRGNPSPKPNARKLSMDGRKSVIRSERAKNAAMNAGEQGITIAPKKKPYNNALITGFLWEINLVCGRKREKSILNINKIEINPKIPNAIGEIILMAPVREDCRIVVNSNPRTSMKAMTPRVINRPNMA